MFLPPQPRFRFYNGLRNYKLALSDLAAGRVFAGRAVEDAERRLAEWLNVTQVILTPQGRYAIYLGLRETIRVGQHVIMSPYTLYDVVNMVVAAGGVPRFADIEEETCNIAPKEVERLIGPETGAVLVTHLHGRVANLDRIGQICATHHIPLLEDACQAFGAEYDGRKAGTVGAMGFFSCGRAKNLNAFLGGMIVTNDSVKAMRIRKTLAMLPYEGGMRLAKRILHCAAGHAATSPLLFSTLTYWVFRHGVINGSEAVTRQFDTEVNPVLRAAIPEPYERRITPMQARLILDQIDRVDMQTKGRMKLAKIYHEGLRDIPGILLPPWHDDFSHIYLSFPIQIEDRGELQRYMMKHGRDVAVQHIGNAADYPCFAQYSRKCSHARRTASSVLLLPTYPGYRASEARKNVEIIRCFFDQATLKRRPYRRGRMGDSAEALASH
jgi:dTDP-4-amino-4,6-dideoxygalactose transaminase